MDPVKDGLNLQSEQTRVNLRELERALSHTITEGQIHAVEQCCSAAVLHST